MQSFTILHTNDIHGRIEGLARIATMVAEIRAASTMPVMYFDLGDVEETSSRISSLTKGAAMHRLLRVAGCDAATIGNGGPMRYGHQVLPEYAAAAQYPLVLANLRLPNGDVVPGVQPTALLNVGELRLGLIGVTAEMDGTYTTFGLGTPPVVPLVRELAAALRQDGADTIILLSHLGLPDDRAIAAELQNEVSMILGAHTHDLLPQGEWIGNVLVAQAGNYAEHLGRIDCLCNGKQLTVEHVAVHPVAAQPSPAVLGEVNQIEVEVAQMLDEIIGELAHPLDYATDRECGVANFMADVLRERMNAAVAIVSAGQSFTGPLPGGPLRRGALWDVCDSSANPGVVAMQGTQLAATITRGLDPAFAAETPRPLRGRARGLLHLSGASIRGGQIMVGDAPIEGARTYRVAGTDWELESYGGYVEREWALAPHYHVPTILREAAEEHLRSHSIVAVPMGRLEM